jgi:hypothetical protein
MGVVTKPQHIYEVHPRKDKRGVNLISDALPFGRLWCDRVFDAIGYAKDLSRFTSRCDSLLRCSGQRD